MFCRRCITWHFEPGTFNPLAKETNGNFYPIVTDHLGTPKELFDTDGNCVWQAEHGLWGEAEVSFAKKAENYQPIVDCNLRFQNQWEDKETGLYYNLNRYYDPDSGQYLSTDPIGLQGGLRTHGYVHDPMQWVDPMGLAGCEPRTTRLVTKIETNAAQQLSKIESRTPNAHYFSRHGSCTTLDQQYIRATTGLTPDGFAGRAMDASRFLNNQIQLNTAQRAQTIFRQTGNTSFIFDMRETVGKGYLRGGSDLIRSTNVKAVFKNGELYTMYPKINPFTQ